MNSSSSENSEFFSSVEEDSTEINYNHNNNSYTVDLLDNKVKQELNYQETPPSTCFYGLSSEGNLLIRSSAAEVQRIMSVFFTIEQYMEIRDSIIHYATNFFALEKHKNSDQMLMNSLLWERVKSALETFKFTHQEHVHDFMQVIKNIYYF